VPVSGGAGDADQIEHRDTAARRKRGEETQQLLPYFGSYIYRNATASPFKVGIRSLPLVHNTK
jgi:hypothetical protein